MIGLPGEISGLRCSRSGCRADATWAINWRNPKIHDASRVKVWLACDEHRDYLYDFVDQRGFPAAITPAGVVVDALPDAVGQNDTP
ncbi:hypothetical protein [Microcella sp.]|uniref:hypothetical protein n=1 Tax=Microcella sp. TaxID=1913979 RepID=UPI00391AC90B